MYNNLNSADLKEQCRTYMAEQGLLLENQLITDGIIHRYSADAKKNKPDEWYVAHEGYTSRNNPYLICIFGSWSKGNNMNINHMIKILGLMSMKKKNLNK